MEWIGQRPRQSLHPSVLTPGEIRKAIGAVKEKPRRHALLDWLEADLPTYFLQVDATVLPTAARA